MKRVLGRCLAAGIFLILLTGVSVVGAAGSWRLDEGVEVTEPRNFRTSEDGWQVPAGSREPSRIGLHELHASGSAQLSMAGYRSLHEKLAAMAPDPSKLYVVDLRQESHGFAEEVPVSWYVKNNLGNEGKSAAECAQDEQTRLSSLAGRETVFVPKGKTDKKRLGKLQMTPFTVRPEKEVAEETGFHYIRIYATDKTWPDAEAVDSFLDTVASLPQDAWLHFHCRAGHGRTTTFLVMYDMLKNPELSFDDAIRRQYLLGGSDLTELEEGEDWENARRLYRMEMLRLFYQYVHEEWNGKETPRPWSTWCKDSEFAREQSTHAA